MFRIKIDTKLLLLGAFVVILLLRECHHSSELSKKDSDFQKMEDFHSLRDSQNLAKINSKVADSVKMSQTIVEYENLSNRLKNELDKYKEGASMVETVIETRVDSILITSNDTVFIDSARLSSCLYADSLIKEFKKKKIFFNFKDEWITLNGYHTYKDILLDSINIRNEFDVILGYKREKWYARRNPVVELKSYNPNSEVVYINNIVTKDKKTMFQKVFNSKPAYLVYGILVGSIINKNR